jgi:hypothetical protein
MKRQTVEELFVRCSVPNDTRLGRDGRSAVDFVMHLLNLAFKISPALLRTLGV